MSKITVDLEFLARFREPVSAYEAAKLTGRVYSWCHGKTRYLQSLGLLEKAGEAKTEKNRVKVLYKITGKGEQLLKMFEGESSG